MNYRINKNVVRLALGGVVVLCAAIVLFLRAKGYISQEQAAGLIRSERHVVPYIMAGLYIVSPALILPTFYLTLLSGTFFGPFWGVVVDVCGATAGSSIAFVISRYVAGNYIKRKIKNKRFHQLLRYGGKDGWKLNAFLRLNPVFPSALIGYFFGCTNIKLIEFCVSTFVFLLPPCILVISLSSSFAEYFIHNNIQGLTIKISMFLLSLIAWLLMKRAQTRKIDVPSKSARPDPLG